MSGARTPTLEAKTKPSFDLEEAQRVAATEQQGRPLDEIMKHLQSQEGGK